MVVLALAFGGTMQIAAGLLAYREGDTFETVAFNSYGAFWWWLGLPELFGLLAATFYLLGAGDFLGVGWLVVAGGYVGIATGVLAMYISFAGVVNWAFDGDVVPLGGAPIDGDRFGRTEPAD